MTTGRKKRKPTKRKTGAKSKRPSYKKGRLRFQKIRNKEIYDLVFHPTKQTTQNELIEKINEVNFLGFNKGELPDSFVKITFVFAKSKKERAAISYVYQDLNDTNELYDTIAEMQHAIYTKRDRASKKHSKTYAKVLRYKNYIRRIIVDFQTAT